MTFFKDWLDEYLVAHPKFAERWRNNAPQRDLRKQFLRARINMKTTQAELAKKAKVSVGTIIRMETGEGLPQVATMVKILDAIGYELIIREKTKPKEETD